MCSKIIVGNVHFFSLCGTASNTDTVADMAAIDFSGTVPTLVKVRLRKGNVFSRVCRSVSSGDGSPCDHCGHVQTCSLKYMI